MTRPPFRKGTMSSPSGMAIGCRAAVGVAGLPGNAPVEIQLVAIIAKQAKNVEIVDYH
ncbi:hypothetical protein [Rhodoferax sp.]|uniref:hypothetical protein n=1 Tax=Rhodoferax sp. TaxID=50421 RepID=UPI003BB57D1F